MVSGGFHWVKWPQRDTQFSIPPARSTGIYFFRRLRRQGFVAGAHIRQPGQTDRHNSVGLRSNTAVVRRPTFPY